MEASGKWLIALSVTPISSSNINDVDSVQADSYRVLATYDLWHMEVGKIVAHLAVIGFITAPAILESVNGVF